MSKKYWIGTIEEYQVELDNIANDETSHSRTPTYNDTNTMVLIAGYGELSIEEVLEYQENNEWNVYEEVDVSDT